MTEKELKKECIGIVNQLFDLAEVPVEKRQAINDNADEYILSQVLRLGVVVRQSEQLFCEKVIHHTCKWFDQYNGCMGCLVKKYEAK